MFHYLKFTLYLLLAVPVIAATTVSGHFLAYGLAAAIVLIVLGDLFLGDDDSEPKYAHTGLLDLQLFLSLPVTVLYAFVVVWHGASGDVDPLGYGALVERLTGFDAIAARNATTAVDYVFGLFTASLYMTLMSTLVAHELTHRTWDPRAMLVGRWLLAFSFDVGFATEHVHGHHKQLGTKADPATAARGANVYAQVARAIVGTNVGAYRIERARLEKLGKPVLSLHNAYLRGVLMSVGLVVVAYVLSGIVGALFFSAVALGSKVLLEIVNYMEHYGLVRVPTEPVQPRHSWNSKKRMSSWATFNLTRHSHHHAQGEVPFWALRPYPDAPMMPSGYLTTILLTLVPSLWHRIMTPRLLEWDAKHASPEERVLAGAANRASGVKALMQATYGADSPMNSSTHAGNALLSA